MSARASRLIVLDLDDTLYPEREYVHSGFRAAGEFLRAHCACPFDPARWLIERFEAGARGTLFDDLVAELRLSPAREWVDRLVARYREHRPQIRPFSDVGPALERLRRLGTLALLSDGPLVSQRNKLAALQLEHAFDQVLFTDSLGRDFWKPDPRPFARLAGDFGVPPAACVYIGDNAGKDFVAPNRLGWVSVQVVRPGGVHADKPAPPGGAPQWRVADLTEAADLLERLWAP